MLIEIPATEKEAHQYACAVQGLDCRFMETGIPGIIKVKVTERGRKISGAIGYRLKGVVEQRLREQHEIEIHQSLLREIDLMQEPKNNVVMLVENIEELPR